MRRRAADHRNDERGPGQPGALGLRLLGLGARIFGVERRDDRGAAVRRASPSKTMKRQGVSLPWSGTREATVNSVSISAADGAGPVSSTALNERRVLRSSRASGMGNTPGGCA
jgi:hypothetical protein